MPRTEGDMRRINEARLQKNLGSHVRMWCGERDRFTNAVTLQSLLAFTRLNHLLTTTRGSRALEVPAGTGSNHNGPSCLTAPLAMRGPP